MWAGQGAAHSASAGTGSGCSPRTDRELLHFTAGATRRMFSCTQEVRQRSKGHDGKGKAMLKVISAASSNEPILLCNLTQH